MRNAMRSGCSGFEAIEPRLMLSSAGLVSVWTENTIMGVVVDYTGVDPSTIGPGDVTFSANGRPDVAATAVRNIEDRPNGVVRVTYGIPAYDAAWGVTDTGTYTIKTPAGQVQDPQGGDLPFEELGQFWLWFGVPKATLTSQTVRSSDWLVVVRYDTLDGVDQTTLNGNNLVLTGGTSPGSSVVSVTALSTTAVQVVYSIQAPTGAWTFESNGAYGISLADGAVKDQSARAATGHLMAQYYLWFAAPKAEAQLTSVSDTSWLIPVTFTATPGEAINPATLVVDGAVTVSGVKGYFEVGHLQTLIHNGDGSYTATYRVVGNGGSWDWTDNGDYSVQVVSGHVTDTSGHAIGGRELGLYHLWFTTPAAQFVLPTHPTQTQWDFTVDFSDNDMIDISSINTSSVRIQGPDGGVIPVALMSVNFQFPGIAHAAYRLLAPGGLDNGNYTVWVNGDGAQDTSGNPIAEVQLASFWLWF